MYINSKQNADGCAAALKIHISGECKKYLDDLGGWVIERRGIIDIKVNANVLSLSTIILQQLYQT